MGDVFTAFMGGVQCGFIAVPMALLWNRDPAKVLRVRRVFSFIASPQYREWIGAGVLLCDLRVYGDGFDARGYYDRPVLSHDQAAIPLGDVVCASGQGVNSSVLGSLLITGTGVTVRRTLQSMVNPSWTMNSSYTHGPLCSCPYYGEIYRASDNPDVQKLTLRRGEALVLWDLKGEPSYRYPVNVVIEFEQDHV